MAAKKKQNPGKPKAAGKRGRPKKEQPRSMPKKPKAVGKRPKAPKEPKPRKLTAEEMRVVPKAIQEAVERGDVSANEVLSEILAKYAAFREAEAKRSDVTKECRERAKQERAALQGAMELPLRTDASLDQYKNKVETCEMRWQEFVEAEQQNKLETREASKAVRAAKRAVDETITGHAQLKLPFGKTEEVLPTLTEPGAEVTPEADDEGDESEPESDLDDEDDFDIEDEDEDEDE